jgi:predicted enzyme related to lactoylglutathione lyase
MKVLRLRSWNFQAPNLEAMTRFYELALGAELRAQQTLAEVKVNRLSTGDTGLGLFDASGKQFPGVPHHTFDIAGPSDSKELIEELQAKGIQVEETRVHGQGPGYSVYITDPNGNRIELSKD